jgi:hypothetical protein
MLFVVAAGLEAQVTPMMLKSLTFGFPLVVLVLADISITSYVGPVALALPAPFAFTITLPLALLLVLL